jgi:hypothetical protein
MENSHLNARLRVVSRLWTSSLRRMGRGIGFQPIWDRGNDKWQRVSIRVRGPGQVRNTCLPDLFARGRPNRPHTWSNSFLKKYTISSSGG